MPDLLALNPGPTFHHQPAPARPEDLPAARVADAFLVEELEALRTRVLELEARIPEQEALRARCAELEARVENLESAEMHAAADTFDFSERLAALEELMSKDWMMQGGGSGSGSTD